MPQECESYKPALDLRVRNIDIDEGSQKQLRTQRVQEVSYILADRCGVGNYLVYICSLDRDIFGVFVPTVASKSGWSDVDCEP